MKPLLPGPVAGGVVSPMLYVNFWPRQLRAGGVTWVGR